MENGKQPIHPTIIRQIGEDEYRIASEKDLREGQFLKSQYGLSKREYFAGLVLQGIISSPSTFQTDGKEITLPSQFAKFAIDMADELLKQLEQ